ncbi:MAG: DUF302 domain-containing protein [Chromatiales bacterium]|nr:DUF302 domain-containing protein [Gammaproteobacteria bacterium]MBW6475824.1 DUF302 domain-containing protein [Chromatiales bacterium]
MLRLMLSFLLLAIAIPASAAEGLTTLNSRFGVEETQQRLLDALEKGGMQVAATIDHAHGAEKVGLTLAPTRLVIFGNPRVGTLLMQCQHSIAIDLPMKMLIWEENGSTQVAYNSVNYLNTRHTIAGCDKVLENVAGALDRFARQASGN